MPLTKRVTFKTKLQRGNRIQVPKLLRGEFKMEPEQVLWVGVYFEGSCGSLEEFYAKMGKDGRFTIPKLVVGLLKAKCREQEIVGALLEVELVPSEHVLEEQDEKDE